MLYRFSVIKKTAGQSNIAIWGCLFQHKKEINVMSHTLLQVKYPLYAPGTRSLSSWYLLLVCFFSVVCGLSVKVIFLQLCQQSLPLKKKHMSVSDCCYNLWFTQVVPVEPGSSTEDPRAGGRYVEILEASEEGKYLAFQQTS